MHIEKKDVSPTLRSQMAGHPPVVCFDPKWLSSTEKATSIMGDNAKDNPCVCYTQSSFGTYRQGFGTVRSNGGDAGGGGSETLVISRR